MGRPQRLEAAPGEQPASEARGLLTVFGALVRAGLVLSLKGPRGGFRLARPAKDITLLEIVEAVDGPIRGMAPQAVTMGDGQLDRELHAACDQVAGTVRERLGRVSVAELVVRRK